MGIGWSEQALHFNTLVNLSGEAFKLALVHFFAHKLA
jgi:hypothetical protein